LVLGSVWLMHTGYAVDRHQNPSCYINKPKEIKEQEREKVNIIVEKIFGNYLFHYIHFTNYYFPNLLQ